MRRSLRLSVPTLIALAVALAVMGPSGCVPKEVEPTAATDGVVLVLSEGPATLVPYTANLAARQAGALVFQPLFEFDESGDPVPGLCTSVPTAENGGVSPDGRTYTLRLDPEARWHDGEPVTASDVVFTLELLRDEPNLQSASPATLARLTEVRAPDDSTVEMVFSEPDWPGVVRMVPFVLPEHLLGGSADLLADPYWDAPVGSGPYRVVGYARRSAVELEAVGEQGIRKLTCVFNNTDEDELRTWENAGRAIWPGAHVDPIGAEGLSETPSEFYRYYLFNLREGRATADRSVRAALASVITTAQVANQTVFATPAPRAGDTASAADQLRSAGYRPQGPESTLARGGEELRLSWMYRVMSPDDGTRVQRQVDAITKMGALVYPTPAMRYGDALDRGSFLDLGEWDVARVVMPEGSPTGFAWPFDSEDVHTHDNPDGLNVGAVRDPELDALYARLRLPLPPEEREQVRLQVGRRLGELTYIVPDERMTSRVLFRGVDGVRSYRSHLDFAYGWRLWALPHGEVQTGAAR